MRAFAAAAGALLCATTPQSTTALLVNPAGSVRSLSTTTTTTTASSTHSPSSSRVGAPSAARRRRLSMMSSAPATAMGGTTTLSPPVEAVAPPKSSEAFDMTGITLSGLNGQALTDKVWPKKSEVLGVVPKHCFEKDTKKALLYTLRSLVCTIGTGALAAAFIPFTAAMAPAWVAYALLNGTLATGLWVIAHECGHGAFSNNKTLQDSVGYLLHSALLVPYFSWQRSHGVHHARTNHMTEGETHVPPTKEGHEGRMVAGMRKAFRTVLGKRLGGTLFGGVQSFLHLVVGWPAYMLWGATGGPVRKFTNHFVPVNNAEAGKELFPGKWKGKVWLSDIGIAATVGGLVMWAKTFGLMNMALLYGAPYLVVNAWLVGITWLQHTDTDVPHYSGEDWNFVKGAFHSIDRPYGKFFDWALHKIGSTHVAHHLDSSMPFYHADEATEAIKEAFPEHYLYDPTPLHKAVWRLATKCFMVEQRGNKWVFVSGDEGKGAAVTATA